jgi:hypothetical protein
MLLRLWGVFRPRQGRGRIAILTGYVGQAAPIRHALTVGTHAIGLTMFERDYSIGRPGRRQQRAPVRAAVRHRQKAGVCRHICAQEAALRAQGSKSPGCPLCTPRPADRRQVTVSDMSLNFAGWLARWDICRHSTRMGGSRGLSEWPEIGPAGRVRWVPLQLVLGGTTGNPVLHAFLTKVQPIFGSASDCMPNYLPERPGNCVNETPRRGKL